MSKQWLFHTGSKFDRKFRESAPYSFSDVGSFLQATIGNQKFLWPGNAPRSGFLQILSEILTPEHPHQYLYGSTQIGPDDVVLDIGACEGAFSAFVTAKCKHVIAVEPSRSMCALMTQLFQIRNEPSPQILNCLFGGEPSTAYFAEDLKNPAGSRICSEPVPGAYELPVVTLDEAVEKLEFKPTFIKCDAEGAEPAIFAGGKKFLKEFHPKLAVTTYHSDTDFDTMYTLLKSLGYSVEGKGLLYSGGVLRVQMIHAW
ncbi:FkbM family methyltransferase [Granulicella sp. dw_53]|uniref:FkbM family methyltransferase n=1 Tax=Granulicella sp. dw_53 TaxID=2719792 RepID=UPI001BD6281E